MDTKRKHYKFEGRNLAFSSIPHGLEKRHLSLLLTSKSLVQAHLKTNSK